MKSSYQTIIAALLIAAGISSSDFHQVRYRQYGVSRPPGYGQRPRRARGGGQPRHLADTIQCSRRQPHLALRPGDLLQRQDYQLPDFQRHRTQRHFHQSPDTYNATANQYSQAKFNYSLTCNVTVSTSNVATVRKLLNRQSELLKEGIPVTNSYISYDYTALNSIKPEMIAQATENAREAAAQFAKDSGSKVGKMKTASQGSFSIDDSSSSTPYIKKVRVVTTIVYYLED